MIVIKFKGMNISGDWVYGLLSYSHGRATQPPEGYYISNSVGSPWAFQIRPETIGQYTGLKDMNGREIYERDTLILSAHIKVIVTYENGSFGYILPADSPEYEVFQPFASMDNLEETLKLSEVQ